MKRQLLAGATVLAATGIALKAKKIIDMSLKDRSDMCSEKFVDVLSRLHEGFPSPPMDEVGNDDVSFHTPRRHRKSCAKGSKWHLGYSKESILPPDIYTKKYCIAGNTRLPANYAKGVLDDIFVRTIALDDGSGQGKVILSCVDCIGLSNKNIREIRKRLSSFSKENNVSSINICSTHTHSSIDTMGIWGPIIEIYKNNKKALTTGEGDIMPSCDPDYMEFLFGKIIESVKSAVSHMVPGKLYESYMGKNSGVGVDENSTLEEKGLYTYVWDRREPIDCSLQLLRLRFVPDDKSQKETILLNFGAHPYINSMKERNKGDGDKISGDFVYSLGDYIERNNYNFIYFNGPVAAVYPSRLYSNKLTFEKQARAVGEEIGRISLAMTKTNDEIYSDSLLNPVEYEKKLKLFVNTDGESNYSKWVRLKGEQVIKETELKPLLNICVKKAKLDIDNPIFYLVGKLRIGSYTILPGEGDKYTSFTEVGLIELGGKRKIALVPGEMEPAVLSGSYAVKSEQSFSGKSFSSTTLSSSADDESLTVFGLSNDAIGYIIPDNDFSMMFLGTGKVMKKLFGNHYLEIFSFGKNTAVNIADKFKEICDEVKKVD